MITFTTQIQPITLRQVHFEKLISTNLSKQRHVNTMEPHDEVIVLFKKILSSQGKNLEKRSSPMQPNDQISASKELTAERLLLRIMKLEHTVQELRQQSTFKDKEIRRLESRVREWQQITLKIQSRVSNQP